MMNSYRNYNLSKCLVNKNNIKYFYKINKLGKIIKNIDNFYHSNQHNDLDIDGTRLNEFYPNLWIDAYLDREDGYYNNKFAVIFELREKTKIKKITYKYGYCSDWYQQWISRFNLYDENDIDYEDIYSEYFKKIIFRNNSNNKNEYFIVFNYKGLGLKSVIRFAHKVNNKINIIKRWINYIIVKRRKEKLLYQFKCLPIYIKNEIEDLYEMNEW